MATPATLIAAGAVSRVILGNVANLSPTPLFSILIKVGLTETLTFVSGFVFGPVIGFVTGALIITISDIFTIPGPWTPFIASIIGLLGICAGLIRRYKSQPTFRLLAVSSVALTLLSESLQNIWVALFYSIPMLGVLLAGIPSFFAALINNFALFTTVGLRTIIFLEKGETQSVASLAKQEVGVEPYAKSEA